MKAPRRFFYVVHLADRQAQDALNLMRYAAVPSAKREAHITVRGPYARRLPSSFVQRISGDVEGVPIEVVGAGTFFSSRQNTVFLRCESPALAGVWHKPDYNDYTPHITVYDGDDRRKAEDIYSVLAEANIRFTCRAGGVSVMEQSLPYAPELRTVINGKALPGAFGKDATADKMATFNWRDRLGIIKTLAVDLNSHKYADLNIEQVQLVKKDFSSPRLRGNGGGIAA